MKTKSMKMLFLILLAALTLSCNRTSPSKKQFFVAFSQANNAEPYRAAQNELMTSLFAQAGDVKLVIADAQQDNSKQVAQVETFIRQRPDLLIVAPNERAALTAVMGEAMEQKIPVICLERDILQPNYSTLVHSDNTVIGRMAGQFVRDYLTNKYKQPRGTVIEIQGLLGVEAAINRHQGAAELSQYKNCRGSGSRLDASPRQRQDDRGVTWTSIHRRCLCPQRSHGGGRVSRCEGIGAGEGNDFCRRRRARRSRRRN